MDDFRPEYIQSLNVARWNHWWYIAAATPIVTIIPAIATRKTLAYLAIPLAYALSWIAVCLAIEHYWTAKKVNAVTPAELRDVTEDTARLFAPVIVLPFVAIYVTLAGALTFGLGVISRIVVRKIINRVRRPTIEPVSSR